MDQDYSQYSHQELLQHIGQLYMDLARSQVMIRHLQYAIKERDAIISDISQSDSGPSEEFSTDVVGS